MAAKRVLNTIAVLQHIAFAGAVVLEHAQSQYVLTVVAWLLLPAMTAACAAAESGRYLLAAAVNSLLASVAASTLMFVTDVFTDAGLESLCWVAAGLLVYGTGAVSLVVGGFVHTILRRLSAIGPLGTARRVAKAAGVGARLSLVTAVPAFMVLLFLLPGPNTALRASLIAGVGCTIATFFAAVLGIMASNTARENAPLKTELKLNWCCDGFAELVQRRGQRGAAIHIDPASDPVGFFLHWQIADSDCMDAVSVSSESPLSLTTTQGILFCPWCGTDLRRHYSR